MTKNILGIEFNRVGSNYFKQIGSSSIEIYGYKHLKHHGKMYVKRNGLFIITSGLQNQTNEEVLLDMCSYLIDIVDDLDEDSELIKHELKHVFDLCTIKDILE